MVTGLFFCLLFCGYIFRIRVFKTPVPIPNTEANVYIADNTAFFKCGKIGHCKAAKPKKSRQKGFIMIELLYIDPRVVALMAQTFLMVGYGLSVLAYFVGVSAH